MPKAVKFAALYTWLVWRISYSYQPTPLSTGGSAVRDTNPGCASGAQAQRDDPAARPDPGWHPPAAAGLMPLAFLWTKEEREGETA